MIDNWSDLASSEKAHPELAAKFQTLRDIINARPSHSNSESDRPLAAQRRRDAVEELSSRNVSRQFKFYLVTSCLWQPKAPSAMQACAVGGNVVAVK
jgi:hypothetical protein